MDGEEPLAAKPSIPVNAKVCRTQHSQKKRDCDENGIAAVKSLANKRQKVKSLLRIISIPC